VQLAKKGYSQARIDGELQDIEYDLKLDRYKTHDIEVVIDRWIIGENATESRMPKSLKTALQMGDGVVMVQKFGSNDFQYFSKNLMDAETGNALPIPEPNTFSFNSPKGSCPLCKGLGTIKKINEEYLVENPNFSINQGALLPLETLKGNKWLLTQIKNILEIFGLGLSTPFNEIPREAIDYLYYGCQKE
jgi:excinuclease ABC subunit A